MAGKDSCESCMYYNYNEEYEYYECEINLDEDEYMRFITSSSRQCPYYKFGDEYTIVRKQI